MTYKVSIDGVVRDATPEETAQIEKDRAEFALMMAAKPAKEAREKRDLLLVQLDAIVSNPLRWAAMTAEKQAALSTYRQALLDVPQQASFPDNINWPVAPT